MKVLFLDFDGVLNTLDHTSKASLRGLAAHYYLMREMVGRVNTIVGRTQARVVATTAWRIEYNIKALDQTLANAGATFHLHSTTPVLCKPRGLEVKGWLDANGGADFFAIVDDINPTEFDEFGRQNLVRTESNRGIQDHHVTRVGRVLDTPDRGYHPTITRETHSNQ